MARQLKNLEFFFKNFLSFGNDGLKMSYKDNGTVLIFGDIGSGKSALNDGISMALFGQPYSRKTIPDLINWDNKNKCIVRVKFELNEDKYEFERTFKPDSYKGLKNEEAIKFEEVKSMYKYIEDLLGIDKKISEQTVFISSKYFKPYIEMDSDPKNQFNKRIFDFKIFDFMKDEMLSRKRVVEDTINKEIGKNEANAESLATEIANFQKSKEENQEKIDILEEEIETLKKKEFKKKDFDEKEYQKCAGSIDVVEEEIEKLQTDLKNLGTKSEKIKEIQDKIKELNDERQKISVDEKKILTDKKYEELKKFCDSSQVKYDSLKETLEKIDIFYSEMAKNKEKIQELKDEISELENENTERIEARKKIVEPIEGLKKKKKALQEDITALETELKEFPDTEDLGNQIAVLKEKKKELGERIEYYKTHTECSECEHELTKEYRKEKFDFYTQEFMKKHKEEKMKSESFEASVVKKETLKKDLKDKKEEQGRLSEEISNAEMNASTRQTSIEESQTKIEKKKKELEGLESKFDKEKMSSTKKEIDVLKEKLKKGKETLTNANNMLRSHSDESQKLNSLNAKKIEINRLEKEKLSLDSGDKNEEKIQTQINEKIEIKVARQKKLTEFEEIKKFNDGVKEDEKKNKEEIKEKQKDINLFKAEIKKESNDTIERLKGIIAESKETSSKLDRDVKKYETLMNMVKGDGIKRFIINKYLVMLNQILAKYLKILRFHFNLVFEVDKKGLDVKILRRGNEIRYHNLSNGQSKIANIAIVFSFIEFLRIKNGISFPMLFLDEIFDSALDLGSLTEVIKVLKENIPYITIITHRENIYELGEKTFNVTHDGKFSKYTLVNQGDILEQVQKIDEV